jgi:hypothetical protein
VKGKDPGILLIQEEIDCCLQKGVPPCRSGMVKRNLVRKIRTLEKCAQRKEFAAARIRTTCCAKVEWCKGRSHEGLSVKQGRQKNKTRNKIARGTQIGRMLGRRQMMHQEGTNGTRNRDFMEQLSWKREDNQRNLQ